MKKYTVKTFPKNCRVESSNKDSWGTLPTSSGYIIVTNGKAQLFYRNGTLQDPEYTMDYVVKKVNERIWKIVDESTLQTKPKIKRFVKYRHRNGFLNGTDYVYYNSKNTYLVMQDGTKKMYELGSETLRDQIASGNWVEIGPVEQPVKRLKQPKTTNQAKRYGWGDIAVLTENNYRETRYMICQVSAGHTLLIGLKTGNRLIGTDMTDLTEDGIRKYVNSTSCFKFVRMEKNNA